MTDTMRAVVLDRPGSVETLAIRDIPIPGIRPGWVLIRVRAFGLNRSELHTRLGLSEGVTFPRVLGIEAVGEIVAALGGEFPVGQKVAESPRPVRRAFCWCQPARSRGSVRA